MTLPLPDDPALADMSEADIRRFADVVNVDASQ